MKLDLYTRLPLTSVTTAEAASHSYSWVPHTPPRPVNPASSSMLERMHKPCSTLTSVILTTDEMPVSSCSSRLAAWSGVSSSRMPP